MDPTGRRYCTGFVIALLLVAAAIRAQTRGTGAISGIVYDPTSRVIGNAEVLAVNNATHMSRLATTTSEGVFRLALLPPGTYAVSVKVPGYEVHISSSVQVTVSVTSSLPVTLVVAGANATVQVNSGSQVAVLGTATPGSLVDETAIKALPLSNRNYTQILGLSPGVIVDLPNAAQLGRGAQNVASNGATPTANNIQFNGIGANKLGQNSAANSNEQVGLPQQRMCLDGTAMELDRHTTFVLADTHGFSPPVVKLSSTAGRAS